MDQALKKKRLWGAFDAYPKLQETDKEAMWHLVLETGMPTSEMYLPIIVFIALNTRHMETMSERVAAMQEQLTAELREILGDFTGDLKSLLQAFDEQFAGRVAEIQNLLDQLNSKIAESVDAEVQLAVGNKLERVADEFGVKLTEGFEKADKRHAETAEARDKAIFTKALTFVGGIITTALVLFLIAGLLWGEIRAKMAVDNLQAAETKFANLARNPTADTILGIASIGGNLNSIEAECQRGSATYRVLQFANGTTQERCKPDIAIRTEESGQSEATNPGSRDITHSIQSWTRTASFWWGLVAGVVLGALSRRIFGRLSRFFGFLG